MGQARSMASFPMQLEEPMPRGWKRIAMWEMVPEVDVAAAVRIVPVAEPEALKAHASNDKHSLQ